MIRNINETINTETSIFWIKVHRRVYKYISDFLEKKGYSKKDFANINNFHMDVTFFHYGEDKKIDRRFDIMIQNFNFGYESDTSGEVMIEFSVLNGNEKIIKSDASKHRNMELFFRDKEYTVDQAVKIYIDEFLRLYKLSVDYFKKHGIII
ncbi:MAG: hypothetical protein ACM31H_05570 [Nitrososphaerales archaeon]